MALQSLFLTYTRISKIVLFIYVAYFKQNSLLLIHTNHTLLAKAIVQNI